MLFIHYKLLILFLFIVMLMRADSISADKDIQYAYIAAIVALVTLNISTCGAFIFLR